MLLKLSQGYFLPIDKFKILRHQSRSCPSFHQKGFPTKELLVEPRFRASYNQTTYIWKMPGFDLNQESLSLIMYCSLLRRTTKAMTRGSTYPSNLLHTTFNTVCEQMPNVRPLKCGVWDSILVTQSSLLLPFVITSLSFQLEAWRKNK